MPKFTVSLVKEQQLLNEMEKYGILEADIVENFIRGSGPGGQKINKTSATVQLHHIPTGIDIKCQETRSQSTNRFLARRLLIEKIKEKITGEKTQRQKEIEKIRRQKRKRTKRSQEKVLGEKKSRGQTKQLRQKPTE